MEVCSCHLITLHIHSALTMPFSQVQGVSWVSELFCSTPVPSGYDRSKLKVSCKPKNSPGKRTSRKGLDLSIGLLFPGASFLKHGPARKSRESASSTRIGNSEKKNETNRHPIAKSLTCPKPKSKNRKAKSSKKKKIFTVGQALRSVSPPPPTPKEVDLTWGHHPSPHHSAPGQPS